MRTEAPAPSVAPPTADVRRTVHWAVGGHDAEGKPFAVIDKRQARIYVYGADGQLAGEAAALLGLARGDAPMARSVSMALSRPEARATPAGRYASEPGHNRKGEAIVWVDYDAALAIHRLRPGDPAERRAERLASPTPDDNRISLGCIVVDPRFYDAVVAPTLGRQRGVVYVLPESADPAVVFGGAAPATE